jgi:hypothetical protein
MERQNNTEGKMRKISGQTWKWHLSVPLIALRGNKVTKLLTVARESWEKKCSEAAICTASLQFL